jgi:hypothetical protein
VTDAYEPEVIQVDIKRLAPREISLIEEHTGYTARKWESDDCPMGKLSEAMAYVMLRRRHPEMTAKELWALAGNTVVEAVDAPVDPTNENGSAQS